MENYQSKVTDRLIMAANVHYLIILMVMIAVRYDLFPVLIGTQMIIGTEKK